jgi:tellurite resistance protein TerC
MVPTPTHIWAIFAVVIVAALLIDLLLFHRKPHQIPLREALVEIAAWIGLALAFNVWIFFLSGKEAALQFFTGYVVEQSMSIDNIFIFILIFKALDIPSRSQHKVLYYGVVGAFLLRIAFIFAGVALLEKFHAIRYLFGAILLVTGIRMLLPSRKDIRPERNWLVRFTRLIFPVSADPAGESFWVQQSGKAFATPLFVALIAVEAMDIIFAFDSVPAVLAITRDPFIAFSSNAFAVLGLRALYFAMAGILPRLRYLHQGLATIVIFVAGKMFASDHLPISTFASLAVIGTIISITVIASMIRPQAPQK